MHGIGLASMNTEPSAKRIDDIELLRAFAVLLVVLEHAHGNLITWNNALFDAFNQHFNGNAGVDLFFAISGFVIARDMLPRWAACHDGQSFFRVSLAFWIRRAWRILPSAWLWLALILLATCVFNQSGVFRSFDASVAGTLAAVFQFYNLHFAHCFMRYDCGANFVYWSLSLEEQFYLALPVFIFLFRGREFLLKTTLLFLVGMQFLTERSFLMAMFRSEALLLGVWIALVASHPSRPSRPVWAERILAIPSWIRLTMTLAILMGMAAVASHGGLLVSWRFSLVALLALLLVWLASFDAHMLMNHSIGKRILLWVGSRSYAIYLIHVPAFYATREIWFRNAPPGTVFDSSWTLPWILTATLLIITLAEINFRLIETPLRRYGTAIAERLMAKTRTLSSF